jgi:gamma-glutamylcyclotransferase
MWSEQMLERCPEMQRLGLAKLPGFRWIISKRGYANVVKTSESEVEGILFKISDSDEIRLDRFEGANSGIYQKWELSVIFEGRKQTAMVYVDPLVEEGVPVDEYVLRINAAIREASLSDEYVDGQLRKFIPVD